jgi:hypothetical protein
MDGLDSIVTITRRLVIITATAAEVMGILIEEASQERKEPGWFIE